MPDYYATGRTVVAVTPTGNSQGTAAALTLGCLNTVTGADGTKGVILPSGVAGDIVRVYSATATNGLPVFPPTGGTINGGSANASVSMEGKTAAIFENVDGTNWAAIFTANT